MMDEWDEYKAEGARLLNRLGIRTPPEGLEVVPILHAMLDHIERLEERLNRERP
jgi:hypothetical protein